MLKNLIGTSLFLFFCTAVLAVSLRGIYGNPNERHFVNEVYKDEGPFELSPERGRFALTYSLVENRSFQFTIPIARFATPDVATIGSSYVSLFAPGVSFIAIPFYAIGKSFGISQVGAYATASFFAILNALLIRAIATRMGANKIASTASALIFIFATPAFSYAVTLYQHHISVFLILLSIYTLIRWKNIRSLLLIWFLIAASIPIDYPNLFLMLPIGIFALARIIILKTEEHSVKINIKLLGFITFIGAALPLAFFLWFNKMSYGNPFQLSGTLKSVTALDENGKPISAQKLTQITGLEYKEKDPGREKSAVGFFKARNIIHGLYIHLISPDRGVVVYTPVILFGVLGIFESYRQKNNFLPLLISIIAINVLLYSMWGDPFGGWAFGSRYLIPSYAIMAIFIAISLGNLRKNLPLILIFFLLGIYSIAVNTLGALSSDRNPPQVEARELQKVTGRTEYYTYQRNFNYLFDQNKSKSFIFQNYARPFMNAFEFYLIVATSIATVFLAMVSALYLQKSGKGNIHA